MFLWKARCRHLKIRPGESSAVENTRSSRLRITAGIYLILPVTPMGGVVSQRAVILAWPLVTFLTLGVVLAAAEIAWAGGMGQPSSYLPKLTSYLQARYTDPNTGEDRLALRRFKAWIDGGPEDKLHYHIQFIFKANNGSVTDDGVFLQDAYVVYPLSLGLFLKAGQFIPPFGLERFQPDWNLDFVDRTDVTNRLIVNGNLGDSFARDRGLQCDWEHDGWKLAAGIFHGAGANNAPHGNGPLGVARLSYGREGPQGEHQWLWRAGFAGSARRDADQDFSAQLPGLSKSLTSHFEGQDMRVNAFAQISRGPLSAQGEYFRAWFEPTSGSEIAATGAYGQVAYQPVKSVILGLRYEWFNSDVHDPTISSSSQWTTAATYDLPWLPLRLVTDYSWSNGGTGPSSVWRIQVQYFLIKGFRLGWG